MEQNKTRDKIYFLIPIILMIALVPLLVRLKIVPLEGINYDLWSGPKENLDFFSYYKAGAILLLAASCIVSLVLKFYQDEKFQIRKTQVYKGMLVYSIFVILSSVLSQYKGIAYGGFIERYEGMYVLLAYMLLLFFTINFVEGEKQVKMILGALGFSATIIGLIGIFQYFNLDLFASKTGKIILLGSYFKELASQIGGTLGANAVYSTLYHYNYVGSYMAMLFPLSFVLFFMTKKRSYKIILGIFTLLMAANWIACRSRAGLIGGVLALILFFIMARKSIFQHWKTLLASLSVLILVFVGINYATHGGVVKRIALLLTDMEKSKNGGQNDPKGMKDVKIQDHTVFITTGEGTFKIIFSGTKKILKDEQDQPVKIKFENGKIVVDGTRFQDFIFTLGMKNNHEIFNVKKGVFDFSVTDTAEGLKFVDNKGVLYKGTNVEEIGFEGKEAWGSARGYIWSRSIPLLKNTILKGYGPDTFIAYFPQYDAVGKLKAYGTTNIIVDKAHNLYLQTALSTGILSLLAMLFIFGIYIVSAVKLYFNNTFDTFHSKVGLAIFVAVCGYLGAGFFNDSVVSVAPVFWTLLGIGFSINMTLKKSENKMVA